MDERELPGGAFILREGGGLARVNRESFPTEDQFQDLIATYPELLAGDLLTPDNPRRWLLVTREAGIADCEDGADRWAVDHIFLDQDATPTFVEVKRRSDSRLKRDVIGQILGYVAFGTAYLAGEGLRERFRERVVGEGGDPDTTLSEFLSGHADSEDFWIDVERKLRSGEVRALIVADSIPDELRRVLEFLNHHMDNVHVAAIELQLYGSEGYRTLVPRVIGQTAAAEDRKARRRPREWSFPEVKALVKNSNTPELVGVLDSLVEWAETDPRMELTLGRGAEIASVHFRVRLADDTCSLIQLYVHPDNGLSGVVTFALLKDRTVAFSEQEERARLANEIKVTIDSRFDADNIERYPLIRFDQDQDALKTREVFRAVVERICAKEVSTGY